jgi:hypothetical protein
MTLWPILTAAVALCSTGAALRSYPGENITILDPPDLTALAPYSTAVVEFLLSKSDKSFAIPHCLPVHAQAILYLVAGRQLVRRVDRLAPSSY